MAEKLAGSVWAAQPVTMILALGFSRRALRIEVSQRLGVELVDPVDAAAA